jgi:hypothetical protein
VSLAALDVIRARGELGAELAAHLVPARRLEERRGFRGSGLPWLDGILGGGWPRAALAELRGRRSSGRTSVLYASLARAIAAGETAALVDVGGALDPRAAAAAGIALPRLLWIRATAAQALKAADLVVAAGGFDLVAVDFGDERPRAPSAAWIRLKHGAERQGTSIVVATPARAVGAFAAAAVELAAAAPRFFTDGPPLLHELSAQATCERGKNNLSATEVAPCVSLAFSFRS